MTKFAAILLAASAAFAAPAFAQDGSAITLRVDTGSVMSSNGGEFSSANTGKPLAAGEKLMINAGSSATAVYEGGCTVSFKDAGVFEVPGECKAGWNTNGGGAGKNAAIIIGAGVIGAALINSADKEDVGPLSAGIRHL